MKADKPKWMTLLSDGPFATLRDVIQFEDWYASHEHKSDWDETRHQKALEIIHAVKQLVQKPNE